MRVVTPTQHGARDLSCLTVQFGEWPVAMNARSEFHLRDGLNTPLCCNVDEQTDFNSVVLLERHRLGNVAPDCILTAEWLANMRQVRVQKIEQRAGGELGNPTTFG
jgi:hypothetical protein